MPNSLPPSQSVRFISTTVTAGLLGIQKTGHLLFRDSTFPISAARHLPSLLAHQIEVFDILPVKLDGKAFEFNDFHERLTLPLPFNRDVATVHRLLFEGILAGNFTPFWIQIGRAHV